MQATTPLIASLQAGVMLSEQAMVRLSTSGDSRASLGNHPSEHFRPSARVGASVGHDPRASMSADENWAATNIQAHYRGRHSRTAYGIGDVARQAMLLNQAKMAFKQLAPLEGQFMNGGIPTPYPLPPIPSLPFTCYPLPATRYPLPTTRYPLPATSYPLFPIPYLLPFTC